MKKNVMMRVASIMLVLVLMTSSVISGTFAKYVTSGESTDTARVARFGVKITANGNLFAQGYEDDKTTSTEVEASASVWGKNGDDVVAPGTAGSLAKMTLTGTPEVDVRVKYAAEVTINDKWVANGDKYFPLVIKVDGTPVTYAATDATADIELAIENAIAAYTKEYQHNTDLSTVADDSLEVTWEWPFYVDDATDKKDTALGDAAAWNLADAGKITVKITTTVEQIN